MTTFLIWLICKIQEQVSTWEKMNLMLEPFDDLKNKMIILEGDFKLSLDSVLEAEGGYMVLKKSSVSMLLILKKNTTYVTFGELEIQENFYVNDLPVPSTILPQYKWFDKLIKTGNNSVYFSDFSNHDISFIGNLVDINGKYKFRDII